MPFKMHKIIYFFQKKIGCLPKLKFSDPLPLLADDASRKRIKKKCRTINESQYEILVPITWQLGFFQEFCIDGELAQSGKHVLCSQNSVDQ